MNRAVAVALAVLVVSSGCSGLLPADQRSTPVVLESAHRVTVTDVVDGDTIDVRFANGTTERVRLLGIDTPETHVENDPAEFEGVPDTTAGRTCLREAGENATAFVTDRLAGETVQISTDSAAGSRGGYGRLLAYVDHEGTDINRLLVATGYARVYDSTFGRSEAFYTAERRAQANGTGVWICR